MCVISQSDLSRNQKITVSFLTIEPFKIHEAKWSIFLNRWSQVKHKKLQNLGAGGTFDHWLDNRNFKADRCYHGIDVGILDNLGFTFIIRV